MPQHPQPPGHAQPPAAAPEPGPQSTATGSFGGSWKVAAADFFCAMMAFFMVMWIISQDEEQLKEIATYFNNPFAYTNSDERPANDFLDVPAQMNQSLDSVNPDGSNIPNDVLEQIAAAFIEKLNIDDLPDGQQPIDIKVTNDGIVLNLFNRAARPVFKNRSADFTSYGELMMENLSWLLDRQTEGYRMNLLIAGHALPDIQQENSDYGPWELSTDQANTVRRALTRFAVDPGNVERVAGYGPSRPLDDHGPQAEENQRIEISLKLNRQ